MSISVGIRLTNIGIRERYMKDYDSRIFKQIDYKEEIQDSNFSDCEFYDCTMNEIVVKSCSFDSCKFYNCTIMNIEFQYTDMLNSEFYHCMLIGIDWSNISKKYSITLPLSKTEACELRYNVFVHLNLKAYDFKGSNLEGSYFDDCNLEGAIFKGCILKGAQFKQNYKLYTGMFELS